MLRKEIVPRLLLIHHQIRRSRGPTPPTEAEIEEFGRLVIQPEAVAARAYFDSMRARGHSLDTLFVDFLAPTARHLGELWDQDRCDFVDVTLGVARLHELLEMFSFADEFVGDDLRHRAILIASPGEKHRFGMDMVAKFMRAAGWTVTIEIERSAEENARSVADEWVGVAGLTMSSDVESKPRRERSRCCARALSTPAFRSSSAGPPSPTMPNWSRKLERTPPRMTRRPRSFSPKGC